nr:hypothetical protein [Tanacetum cinerariifolium]
MGSGKSRGPVWTWAGLAVGMGFLLLSYMERIAKLALQGGSGSGYRLFLLILRLVAGRESEIFYFDIKEKNSGSTTIHADISLSGLECFNFKREPDLSELTSIVDSGIRENVLSVTNVNLPLEEDHSPLIAYVV